MSAGASLQLSGDDNWNTYRISSPITHIFPSAASALDCERVVASSKIKIKPAVKFFWEYRYYLGRLICRHSHTPLIAYCINNKDAVDSGATKTTSLVRVRNVNTAQKLLLKSFNGRVVTMGFADLTDPILAVLDRCQTLYVFKIGITAAEDDTLCVETLLVLQSQDFQHDTDNQCLYWCPRRPPSQELPSFVPSTDSPVTPGDSSLLLAVSCGKKIKVFDVRTASRLYLSRANGSCSLDNLLLSSRDAGSFTELRYCSTEEHDDIVTVIQLSRDGSMLASACLDGKVRIFSLLSNKGSSDHALVPVHAFSPHSGLPLYGMIFIDDRNDDGCTWSHLLTGAQCNRELRLWSTSDWSCVQVIRFYPAISRAKSSEDPDSGTSSLLPTAKPSFIMSFDWTNSFLVTVDITRRVLYILALTAEHRPSPTDDADHRTSHSPLRFTSISEFILTTPCILFSLGTCTKKRLSESELSEHSVSLAVPVELVSLEIHSIHTWYLLNGTIVFELPSWEHPISLISESSLDVESSSDVMKAPTSPIASVNGAFGDPNLPCSPSSPCTGDLLQIHEPSFSNITAAVEHKPEDRDLPVLPSADLSPKLGEPILNVVGKVEDDLLPLRPTDFSPTTERKSTNLANDILCSPCDEMTGVDASFTLLPSTFRTPTQTDEHEPQASVERLETADLHDDVMESPIVPPAESIEDAIACLTFMERPTTPDPLMGDRSKPLSEIDLLSCDVNCTKTSGINVEDFNEPLLAIQKTEPTCSSDVPLLYVQDTDLMRSEDVPDQNASSGIFDSIITNEAFSCLPQAKMNWSTMSLYSSSTSSVSDRPLPEVGDAHSEFKISASDRMQEPESSTNEAVMRFLKLLVAESHERTRQTESIMRHVMETEKKIQLLSECYSDLVKRLPPFPDRGQPCIESQPGEQRNGSVTSDVIIQEQSSHTPIAQVSSQPSLHSHPANCRRAADEGKHPDWSKEVLLQFRSQHGDFTRRFGQLENLINVVLSNVSEVTETNKRSQTRISSTSAGDCRLDQLPKMTTDLIRPMMRSEIQNAFVNNVPRITESIQSSLRVMQDCLSTLPSTVAEQLSRTLREKNFVSQLSRSLSASLAADIAGPYRDSLQRVFIPALEKNVTRLFEEVNTVFRAGTQQYLDEVSKRINATFDPCTISSQLACDIKRAIDSSTAVSASHVESKGTISLGQNPDSNQSNRLNNAAVFETLLQSGDKGKFDSKSIGTFRPESSSKSSRTVDRGTVEVSDQPSVAGVVPSRERCATDSHSKPNDTQLTKVEEFARLSGQAQGLIRSNRLVEALELALISTNQALVLDICNDIDPDQLFRSGQYVIGQNVLLSLIHQLICGDFSNQLDVKLRYLQGAVVGLNKSDPTTIEHGPRIMNLLTRRLETFLDKSCSMGSHVSSKLPSSVQSRIVNLKWLAKNFLGG